MRGYILFLLIILLSCNSRSKDEKIKPTVKDITESVYASARVIPKYSYLPHTPISGIVKKTLVKEGDIVIKDQPIVIVTPGHQVKNNLTNAELSLSEAKKNYIGENNLLKNIELELQTAKDQLVLDSINYQRYRKLRMQNIGSKIDYDRAKLTYEATEKRYLALKKKYAQTQTSLETNYKKAKSSAFTQQNILKDYIIKSEIDGRVYSLSKKAGELITTQEQFAEIGSADSFIIEMDIDEIDITKITLGDTVTIILDAYPNKVFTAIVDRIYPKKNEKTQTFKTEGVFVIQPDKLYNGLSGEANIIVDKRENAMIIPTEYLLENDKVLTNDGEKKIQVGVKSLKNVEIISGVDTNTELLKPQQ